MKVTLEINDDGNLSGLYTDKINLFDIGRVTNVRKASNVEFCEQAQQWQVTSIDGKILYNHTNRQQAIEWEIVHFSPGGQYYEYQQTV